MLCAAEFQLNGGTQGLADRVYTKFWRSVAADRPDPWGSEEQHDEYLDELRIAAEKFTGYEVLVSKHAEEGYSGYPSSGENYYSYTLWIDVPGVARAVVHFNP